MRRSSGSTRVSCRLLDTGVSGLPVTSRRPVWRAYKYLLLPGKDNTLQEIDLGLVNSSAAGSLAELQRQPAPRARRDHRRASDRTS